MTDTKLPGTQTLEQIFEQIQKNELTNPTLAAIRVLNAVGSLLDGSANKQQFEDALNRATDAVAAHGYKKRPIHPKAANLFRERQVWVKAFVESWRETGAVVPLGCNPNLEVTLRIPGTAGPSVVMNTAYGTIMANLLEAGE